MCGEGLTKNIKESFPFALALLLHLCGCRTYLGYDLENVEALAQTEEPVRSDLPQDMLIEVAHGIVIDWRCYGKEAER